MDGFLSGIRGRKSDKIAQMFVHIQRFSIECKGGPISIPNTRYHRYLREISVVSIPFDTVLSLEYLKVISVPKTTIFPFDYVLLH